MLSSTRVNLPTSASGSQPQGNTKKDMIQQTQSRAKKNKIEAYPRNVRTSLRNKKSVVNTKDIASVPNSKLNMNSDLKCATCNGCLFSDNHDSCVLEFINSVNARVKSKSTKKPLNRKIWKITTTAIVPLRKLVPLESNTSKPVVTSAYSWKPKEAGNKVPVSNSKINKSLSANKKKPNKSWGSIISNVPSSSTVECRLSKLFSVKFGNDHVAKIMGYGDYKIGNVTISRVYFVEGLGHNLFSVGQFCDSELEVAFRQHTCFIRNLEGVDLLTESQGNNLYTLSLGDMMASSPICLLSKASKTKSWLWHRHLSHLNFGKSKKKSNKPKSGDTNQEKLYLMHMDLCGPMPVESVNGKKYILVIVDDYSRFTWVRCLRSKDEAPDFIIKFLKMIQADIGIFIGYAPTKKVFRIYNRRTRRIVETIHVDFDELTAMASEQSSSGPALHEMTPATSSGLVPKPTSSTPVDPLAPQVIAPIDEVVAPELAESTGSPSSTIVDQDAPSPSKYQTTPETQRPVIPHDVEEDNHDIEVAYMGNDPLFGMPIPEVDSDQPSSTVSSHTIMHPNHQISQHNSKWTKDHPLENIIGQLSQPVSTRLQLHKQALFYYYDAFPTFVEPKTYKYALTQSC
nr:hypothetical protein [Tanacetum cinerariifolium]